VPVSTFPFRSWQTALEHALIDEEDRMALLDLNRWRVQIKHHGGVIPPDAEDDARSVLHSAAWVLDRIEGRLAPDHRTTEET
jgi:hypothetical protein